MMLLLVAMDTCLLLTVITIVFSALRLMVLMWEGLIKRSTELSNRTDC